MDANTAQPDLVFDALDSTKLFQMIRATTMIATINISTSSRFMINLIRLIRFLFLIRNDTSDVITASARITCQIVPA
jgi:hypothetical protein